MTDLYAAITIITIAGIVMWLTLASALAGRQEEQYRRQVAAGRRIAERVGGER